MSVVPSVNASSSSVLPTFFGAISSERPVQESSSGSTRTESGAGGPNTFSEALQQSTDPTHHAEPSSSQGDVRDRSESSVSAKAITNDQGNSEDVGQYLQTDLPLDENSIFTSPADGLAATAHHSLGKGSARPLRDKPDADETASAADSLPSPEVTLPATDSIAGAVVAIHTATQSNSQEVTVVEDEADSELTESDELQLNQKPEEREQSSSDAFNATKTKEATGEADLVAPAADLPSPPTSQLTSEALKQLRTTLETDFGVRPDRSRQLGNRVHLQGGSLRNQAAETSSQLRQSSQGIDPTVAASSGRFGIANNNSSVANPVDSLVDPEVATLPVSSSPSDLSVLEADGLPADTAQNQLLVSTDRGEANGSLDSINRRSSAAKFAPNNNLGSAAETSSEQVVDQSQYQVSQLASVGREDVGAAEATFSRVASDSVLASTVTAGVANTKSTDTETDTDTAIDADELQVDSVSSDGGDIPLREAAKADVAATGRLHTPVDTRGSEYSEAASSNAGSSNPIFSAGQSPSVDSESLVSTSVADDLPVAVQPETTSVVDSDLDLLQQLLPRETSTPFGQSVGAAADNLTDPTNLPRQIAARVLGEAEVLEAGDSARFRMKLDPPELGSVMVEMQKSIQGTTITVTAADPATQQLLQDSLQQLNQSDADEASIFENLAFDLSDGDQGESQDRDTRKSQAQKLRIAGSDLGKADSESASQTSTELDFVA